MICDRPRLTASVRTLYWNLAMLDVWDSTPRVRTQAIAVDRGRRLSTTIYRRSDNAITLLQLDDMSLLLNR